MSIITDPATNAGDDLLPKPKVLNNKFTKMIKLVNKIPVFLILYLH